MSEKTDKKIPGEFFKSCGQMMYDIAFGILHSRADAEDVVQDTFLWIINDPERVFKIPHDNRERYFASVIRHRCFNVLKKRKLHPTDSIDEYCGLGSDIYMEDAALDTVMRAELKKLIGKMSEADQYILRLFYFEEKSHSEISEIMGISNSNARIRLHRAKKRLKAILEEAGFDYDN